MSSAGLTLYIKPLDTHLPLRADIKRSTIYNSTPEGDQWDNRNITGSLTIDGLLYFNSNEMHLTRIRQQDPVTGLWSLCDVHMYPSYAARRVSIWVKWIEFNVDFS